NSTTAKINIEGFSSNIDIINKFISSLNTRFQDVQLLATEQEKFGKKVLVSFIITFNICQ
ncbi:MAG: hypothetical protein KKH98_11100, partial [Spirochaetes bacterium]|nr:hypothetical protein [Spirochaetota bacterium]